MTGRPGRVAAALLALAASAAGADGRAPVAWARGAVVSVTVESTGLGDDRRDPVQDEPCAGFRPTAPDVRHYFNRAKSLTRQQYAHDTVWTACHAAGRLRLVDGREAEWTVRRGGAGAATIGSQTFYFDCQPCRDRLERPPGRKP